MRKKHMKWAALGLALAAVCLLAGERLSYPIQLDLASLPGHIQAFYDRGRSTPLAPTVRVYSGVGLDRNEYYLIEIGEDLGIVTLERGLTGRYRIASLSYGSGNFREGIVESGGKKHLLFGGRDAAEQLSKIAVSIHGQTYDLAIEDCTPRHFLECVELDGSVEDTCVDLGSVVFYNDSGEDVTALYDLSGGGI